MKTNLKNYMRYLKANPLFVGIFEKAEDVFKEFAQAVDEKIKFCYAYYEYEDYSGNAVVFYYRTDTRKYYEAYGSHCSCYGLEESELGMEEIMFEELERRLNEGYLYDGKTFKGSYEAWKEKQAG